MNMFRFASRFLIAFALAIPAVHGQTPQTYNTVATIAALKAMTNRPQVVQVTGTNAGTFNLNQGACVAADDLTQVQPTSGTTVCYVRAMSPYAVGATGGDVTVTATGSTTPRSLANRFADSVNAADFGVSPSNPDNTAAINAAITAIYNGGLGGGCVTFNSGEFSVSGTLSVLPGVNLCGAGWSPVFSGKGTAIVGTGASGQYLIDVGDGSNNPNNNIVRDISIYFSNAQSAGAAIRVRNGHTILLQKVRIDTNNYVGIQLEGGAGQYGYFLKDIEINAAYRGVWVGPSVTSTPGPLVQNVTFENVVVASATDACIYLQNVSGVQGGIGSECLNGSRGMVMAPRDNERVAGVYWTAAFFDTINAEPILIAPTGSSGCNKWVAPTPGPLCGMVSNISLVNTWSSSSQTAAGIRIESTSDSLIDGVLLTAPTVIRNFLDGIRVIGTNTKNVHITAPHAVLNNVANNSHSGIYFGAGVTNFSVIGGCSGRCAIVDPGESHIQTTGIEVATGASDNYTIQGVNVVGNVVTGIFDNGTGVSKTVFGNPGASVQQVPAGALTFKDATTGNQSMTIDGALNTNAGAAIKFLGDGVSTPSKWLRVHNGTFQIVNNGFSSVIGSLTDGGVWNVTGGYSANGSAGLSVTKTVRDSAGTGTCTLVFTFGLLTGGTC